MGDCRTRAALIATENFIPCPEASALARNDPGLLTKTDPGSPPPAGMIMPYLPSACGPRPGPSRWVNLSEHKWVTSGERRGSRQHEVVGEKTEPLESVGVNIRD